ncbi:MAG: hypothetical protein WC911_05965 [Thermoleophilia bacterium]
MDKDIDERNNSVNNTYSSGGSLASRVDPLYAPYMFSYDVMGRPTIFTDPLGAQTTFSRDSLGRLVTRTDGRGISQSFNYDLNGRVSPTPSTSHS